MICGVGSSSPRGGHLSSWKQATAQWRQIQQFPCGLVCLCNHTRVGSYTPGRRVHVDSWCGSVHPCVPGSQTSQSRDTCGWVWLCVLPSTAAKLCAHTRAHLPVCAHTHAHLLACAPFTLSLLNPQDTLSGTLVKRAGAKWPEEM